MCVHEWVRVDTSWGRHLGMETITAFPGGCYDKSLPPTGRAHYGGGRSEECADRTSDVSWRQLEATNCKTRSKGGGWQGSREEVTCDRRDEKRTRVATPHKRSLKRSFNYSCASTSRALQPRRHSKAGTDKIRFERKKGTHAMKAQDLCHPYAMFFG